MHSFDRLFWSRVILLTVSFLFLAGGARATPNFPAALSQDLELPSAPDCSLCHTDGDRGGTGTVNTPFGKSMRARGLVAYDTGSLSAALALMKSENVDSAGGCLPDVAELAAGRDPNAPADLADCDGGGAVSESRKLRRAAELRLQRRRVTRPGAARRTPVAGAGLRAARGIAGRRAALGRPRQGGSDRPFDRRDRPRRMYPCPAVRAGMLAHPTMTTSPMDGAGIQHVYSVQEGAVGGGAAAEGGCGCN